ncbi:YkvA family protein [Crocosphaera sp. XPORK-15E]|uniref:YkvA family protein n=1 Tax=Crocosphaera sp. XPORK-15E TaxID=3110247 RepID=UPI002B1ED6DB|nr:YkvA family protein [Crocosphaera sp. XPORK-15E]MEA5534338.1 YkvA family protein [Crocosphaera sp. XPORK-15E]
MKFPLQFIYDWYRNAIRHPQYRWWVILGTLVYFISPLDISPDVFPIAGQIDDFVLITLLMTEIFQMIIERFQNNSEIIVEESPEGETIEVKAVSIDES